MEHQSKCSPSRLHAALLLVLLMAVTNVHARLSLKDVKDDVTNFLETGNKSPRLNKAVELLRLQVPFKGRKPVLDVKVLKQRAGNSVNREKLSCGLCNLAAGLAISWARSAMTRNQIISRAISVCNLFNIQKEHVCRGFAEVHVDYLRYLVRARQLRRRPIIPNEICGLALYPDCPLLSRNPQYSWTMNLTFLGDKPPVNKPPEARLGSTATPLKVLHITDVHVDPGYSPGSNALCEEPVCCRWDTLGTVTPRGAAGYWGDYRDCDSPMHAFRDLMQHAAKQHHDIDYIFFTGDAIDHAIWLTEKSRNSDVYKGVLARIRDAFPDVMLLPALGNHEAHPVNTFITPGKKVPTYLSSEWLYELAAEAWGEWLPLETMPGIFRSGHYAYEIRPGLMVVAINNNLCYTFNWWLMDDPVDPAGQLRWLAETLLKAEQENKKVHILAHVPGNSVNCLAAWRNAYQAILHRFENTVVAQFHGHEHTDFFTLYYDPEDPSRATNVAFTAGSATPYTDVNPNYRVYYIEPENSFRVLDHETWYYNLTEANLAGSKVPPNWKKLYSFKDAFDVPTMEPSDLHELVLRMANDTALQKKYFGYTVRLADPALKEGCDDKCLRNLVCDIVTSDPSDPNRCCRLTYKPSEPQKSTVETENNFIDKDSTVKPVTGVSVEMLRPA